MSPLPGWRLVWSLYGRFWCRSSLEARSVAHGRAGMWSRAMWRGQPSHLRSTTARTGDQTTADPCACCSGIPEMATELSSAAWIIGQRNGAAWCLTEPER
jgi:hypothetical protein